MFTDAQAYERFMGRWSERLAPRFLDAVGMPPPSRVLDLGCGTGNLTRAVAGRWLDAEVVGVDPATAFVEAAATRLAGFGPRVRFEVGGADDLPLADDSVDAALSLLVLNFVPDPRHALAELCRVTVPGGILATAVWDYGRGMSMVRALWDAAARLDPGVTGQDEAAMPLARPGALAGLWHDGGLAGVADGGVDVALGYPSFDDYWAPFLGGTGPAGAYVAGLSDEHRAALRAQVLADLGPGPFELTARAWWVRGSVPT